MVKFLQINSLCRSILMKSCRWILTFHRCKEREEKKCCIRVVCSFSDPLWMEKRRLYSFLHCQPSSGAVVIHSLTHLTTWSRRCVSVLYYYFNSGPPANNRLQLQLHRQLVNDSNSYKSKFSTCKPLGRGMKTSGKQGNMCLARKFFSGVCWTTDSWDEHKRPEIN